MFHIHVFPYVTGILELVFADFELNVNEIVISLPFHDLYIDTDS